MDFEKMKDFRNHKSAFGKMLGIVITDIQTGKAEAVMEINETMTNPIGSVHGGCLFTIADIAGGAAASSYGYHITTVDSSFYYLRAGMNTRSLKTTAEVVKHGKRMTVVRVSVADQDGVVLAEGMFTYMSLGKEIELQEMHIV